MFILNISLIFCIFFTFSFCEEFPSDIKRCKYEDSQCIQNIINKLFESGNGHPGLNLVKLNPLAVKTIEIKRGKDSPVNIELKFTNSMLTDIETIKAYKTKGFGKDLKGPHEILFKGERYQLNGDYNINGKVLILPITGSGKSNITLVNPDIKIVFTGKPKEKNGKTFMEIDNFKFSFTVKRLVMHFENLFNSDKTLGDNMNAFLNENWEEIFNELKGPIYEAFGIVYKTVIGQVYLKYPYEELYLNE